MNTQLLPSNHCSACGAMLPARLGTATMTDPNDLLAEAARAEAHLNEYSATHPDVVHCAVLLSRLAARVRELEGAVEQLTPDPRERFVRCSVEIVEQMKSAASQPVTLQVTERSNGELYFVATRHDCPAESDLAVLRADKERLDWLEALAVAQVLGVTVNYFPPENGNVLAGEPEYHFSGGFQLGDDSSEPYYPTLRAAIDAARHVSE